MERLIDVAGHVRLGIFPTPVEVVNHHDFLLTTPFGRSVGRVRRYFAFNQFQFLGALSEELVFGCAIADVKYAGTVFAYTYEPPTRRLRQCSFHRPLARGIQLDQLPETGRSTFRAGANSVEMQAERTPRQRHLRVRLADGFAIDATFSEEEPALQPMFTCTPVAATGWVYARKTAGHRVSGTVRLPERTIDLATINARGHHDWTAGYMRRQTFWNWGCLAGTLADGRVVGLNVACGVNETSFTENCFWLDGALHKIDTVYFDYDPRRVLEPWRLTSFDGRLDLTFRPETEHAESLNAWLVASNFHQLIGRYDGHLTTATGEQLQIERMLGYAEHHYAKW